MAHFTSSPAITEVGIPGASETVWRDMKSPFFGLKIDTAAGHLDYDIAELGINYDDTSRYNDLDMIGIDDQMNHEYKIGSNCKPHMHWIQNQNAVPNMLLKYRVYDNGQAPPAWTLAAPTGVIFTYTSGSILQILYWPDIDMSGLAGLSAFYDVKIFRDAANTSTLFAGADPYTGDVLTKEFDMHYEVDMSGSRTEYTK